MLRTSGLCLAILALTACPSPKPKADDARADAGKRDGEKADAPTGDAKGETKPEAATGAAAATGGGTPAPAKTGPDTLAAKLNPEGCTKPTEGKPVAYRLRAFGAQGSASVELRLEVESAKMTGKGFRLDAGGLVDEEVNHQIDPAKVAPFTAKLDAMCLNFAPMAPDAPNAPQGFTRYGVEFEDGSVRWMSDTNPGLGGGEVFGKVERDKWLDLNSSWPKYQDAKAIGG